MCIRLWHVPKISRKFVGEWNFVLLCYGHVENRTGYHPALVQLFRGIFLQGTWRTLSMEAKERDAPVVGAFAPVPLLCIGMISSPTFRCPCKTPCPLTHTSHQNHPTFQVPIIRYPFPISLKLGFSSGIRKLSGAQFYGSFHLCYVKASRLKNFAQFCQTR